MAGRLPPLDGVSANEHGAGVIISAYSWASLTAIAAAGRLMLALKRKMKPGLDDFSFVIAVLFAITSSVLYHLAVNAGLGRHMSGLDTRSVTLYFKTIYSAQLFGIAAIGCGKLSAVHLSGRACLLEPSKYRVMLVIVAAWTVFSLLVTAFQCHLPSPWAFAPSNCPTRGYLQYVVSISNIITDVIHLAWIAPLIWKLNMVKESRITVLVLFSLRIIISCVIVGQMAILPNALRSSDQTWDNVTRALIDQTIINLSVIFATVPRVNRLFYSFRDDIVLPQISRFELGDYDSRSGNPQEGQRERKLAPSTDTKLNTSITGTSRGPTVKHRKSLLVMGSQEDEEASTSSLRDCSAARTSEASTEIGHQELD